MVGYVPESGSDSFVSFQIRQIPALDPLYYNAVEKLPRFHSAWGRGKNRTFRLALPMKLYDTAVITDTAPLCAAGHVRDHCQETIESKQSDVMRRGPEVQGPGQSRARDTVAVRSQRRWR
jgi:hypothetical protein